LLALFNDLTMLPIAYDLQQASALPENPNVTKLLIVSAGLGGMETVASLLFAYGMSVVGFGHSDYRVEPGCATNTQAAIWLQMFISAELLIFSARAPSFIFTSIRPSIALLVSVISGCLIVSIMAALSDTFGSLPVSDIASIWLYDVVCLLVIDTIKVIAYGLFNESTEVLPDEPERPKVTHEEILTVTNAPDDLEANRSAFVSKKTGVESQPAPIEGSGRQAAQSMRLNSWSSAQTPRSPERRSASNSTSLAQKEKLLSSHNYAAILSETLRTGPGSYAESSVSLRKSIVHSNSLRRATPGTFSSNNG